MPLTDYISAGQIRLNFQAAGKAEALAALCGLAAETQGLAREEVLAVVQAREALGSTGLGGGVALPHGRLPDIPGPVLVLALSPEGVDFDSLDGRPVQVLALALTVRGRDREHLRLLAGLGAMFKSPAAVAELLAAKTPAQALAFLARH